MGDIGLGAQTESGSGWCSAGEQCLGNLAGTEHPDHVVTSDAELAAGQPSNQCAGVDEQDSAKSGPHGAERLMEKPIGSAVGSAVRTVGSVVRTVGRRWLD